VGRSDSRGAEDVSGMREWVSFAEIKSRITLEQVLRSYGVNWLRRSGVDQYRGRCPIHGGQGKDAFHANLSGGLFHCFACGAGGNVLDFVAAMEGDSIREAALRLQASGGESNVGTVPAAVTLRERKLVTKKRSVNPPLAFTLELDRRHSYLARRGIEGATADHFGVGYFRGRGLMSGRIAIPIYDDAGRLVAYCGRAVDEIDPRYRFPAGFQKSQVLFHYDRARAAVGDQVIVVEGFFDCMRVYQAGFANVVALMGARLSAAQKRLLADRFPNVVLLLDGDATGRAATRQIASDLAGVCSVTPLLLSPGTQPDQMTTGDIRLFLAERRLSTGANRPI
jgi:DNA primase